MPVEFYYQNNPNVWVITLHRFYDEEDTNEERIAIMNFWKNNMRIHTIRTTDLVLGTGVTDPLVAKTFAIPDIRDRIVRFTSGNGYDDKGPLKRPFTTDGDLSALEGLVFLNTVPTHTNNPYH